MAHSLSNKCAKNLCKRIVLVQLIFENVVTFFCVREKVLFEEWDSPFKINISLNDCH